MPAVAEAAFGVRVFVFREEPEADGNLRAVEELAGEGNHAVHEVGLDEGTDLSEGILFAGVARKSLSSNFTRPLLFSARIPSSLRAELISPPRPFGSVLRMRSWALGFLRWFYSSRLSSSCFSSIAEVPYAFNCLIEGLHILEN